MELNVGFGPRREGQYEGTVEVVAKSLSPNLGLDWIFKSEVCKNDWIVTEFGGLSGVDSEKDSVEVWFKTGSHSGMYNGVAYKTCPAEAKTPEVDESATEFMTNVELLDVELA